MKIIFLPATDPLDSAYGNIPTQIDICPEAKIYRVYFPRLVWYNAFIRKEAIRQIKSFGSGPFVLIGFSKSGLGAWNIVRSIPSLISRTIIFDAPVARQELPPWGMDSFYKNNNSWRKDLPLNNIELFKRTVDKKHLLVLISGKNFHDEMALLAQKLVGAGINHVFLPRPHIIHHWNSGWIEEGIKYICRH